MSTNGLCITLLQLGITEQLKCPLFLQCTTAAILPSGRVVVLVVAVPDSGSGSVDGDQVSFNLMTLLNHTDLETSL